MTVRTEFHPSIPAAPEARNASPAAFPALAGSRARSRPAGPTVHGLVWILALVFFVFAIAVPASVMQRHVEASQVALAGQGP
jgi:hypothetical protein